MSKFEPYSIYGIIGYPLAQTLSPLIHTTSFYDQDIPSILVPWAIESAQLEHFFESFKLLGIQGCCVTIPHKSAVIPYLDCISERAKHVGAVNLIYKKEGQLYGDNTDVKGFMKPLEENPLSPNIKKVLVLGAGGASRAVIVALKALGFTDISITNHNSASAIKLAEEFKLTCIDWNERTSIGAQFIVNTTPLGMKGKFIDETPYPKSAYQGEGVVYDIVYTPKNTRFIQEAEESGWKAISGLDMFIGQANEQYRIWTGHNLSQNAIDSVLKALL